MFRFSLLLGAALNLATLPVAASDINKTNLAQGVKRWENNEIVLSVGQGFSLDTRARFFKAINHWATKTNMRFRIVALAPYPENSGDPGQPGPAYLVTAVKVESKCATSGLGRPPFGEVATISLSDKCDWHSMAHEIGHVVGFVHEHQRPKRAQYLNIVDLKRLRKELIEEFGIDKGRKLYAAVEFNIRIVPVYNDDAPYDMSSIMQYGSYPANNVDLIAFFKKRKLPMFTDKSGNEIILSRQGLSANDIKKINFAYPALNAEPYR